MSSAGERLTTYWMENDVTINKSNKIICESVWEDIKV